MTSNAFNLYNGYNNFKSGDLKNKNWSNNSKSRKSEFSFEYTDAPYPVNKSYNDILSKNTQNEYEKEKFKTLNQEKTKNYWDEKHKVNILLYKKKFSIKCVNWK